MARIMAAGKTLPKSGDDGSALDPLQPLKRSLSKWLSRINAEVAVEQACRRCGLEPGEASVENLPDIIQALKLSIKVFLGETEAAAAVEELLYEFRLPRP